MLNNYDTIAGWDELHLFTEIFKAYAKRCPETVWIAVPQVIFNRDDFDNDKIRLVNQAIFLHLETSQRRDKRVCPKEEQLTLSQRVTRYLLQKGWKTPGGNSDD